MERDEREGKISRARRGERVGGIREGKEKG